MQCYCMSHYAIIHSDECGNVYSNCVQTCTLNWPIKSLLVLYMYHSDSSLRCIHYWEIIHSCLWKIIVRVYRIILHMAICI